MSHRLPRRSSRPSLLTMGARCSCSSWTGCSSSHTPSGQSWLQLARSAASLWQRCRWALAAAAACKLHSGKDFTGMP